MRKCAVCGKEFQVYVPIEQKYIDMPKQYGREREAKSELLNKVEYSCPYCYSADRDRMIIMFLKKLHAELSNGIDILEIKRVWIWCTSNRKRIFFKGRIRGKCIN